MSLCVLAGGVATRLAAAAFTLSWVHSVEGTEWRESWRVEPAGLVLAEARVKGSGAGMDPGEGARLEDGWWVWTPDLPPQPRLVLAASGATRSAWTLCTATRCLDLGATAADPVEIAPCGIPPPD